MKAYIINLKSLLKFAAMTAAAAAVTVFLFSYRNVNLLTGSVTEWLINKQTVLEAYPVFNSVYYENHNTNNFIKLLLNEELDNPDKVMTGAFPVLSAVKEKLSEIYVNVYESNSFYKPPTKEKEELPEITVPENAYTAIETTSSSVIENGNYLEKKGITVKNHTSYNPNLSELYNQALGIDYSKDDVNLLIVHTHGTESYNPKDRSEDVNDNIVRVGTEMAKVFEKNGVGVVHSKVMHDIPRFNSSYSKSLLTITEELSKNPKINIVLDVHRDAMLTESGDSYKVVCDYNGEKIAQVMFVVGTDGNGLSHPEWKKNLALAMKFQEALNKKCPNLARPIDLRNERFNQQTTTGTLIIEIGTNGNTLDEAVKAGVLAAEAISEVITSL